MPTICFSLQTGAKANTNSALHKLNFYQLLNVYNGFIQIYTDGSKDGNRVAAAMVHRHSVVVTARLPDGSSIFSAEAHAVVLALEFIEAHGSSRFVIFSDSMSCLQAINNAKWSNPIIRCILEKCHVLCLAGKEIHFCWIPSHVDIPGNDRADSEARAALKSPMSDCEVPHTDYKQMVSLHLRKVWQTHWNNITFNKLQAIKSVIGETNLKGVTRRRDAVVLHRTRIGHTHLTHCFLLKGEDQPQCNSCNSALTVRHILLDCPHLQNARKKYFNVGSLSELFSHFSAFNILNFLQETGFYQRF
jgi:ribonuclease HI